MDYNSTQNQRIKGELVKREVLTCFSSEMDSILSGSSECGHIVDLPTWENVENLFHSVCYDCGEEINDDEELIEDEDIYRCPHCKIECSEADIESEKQKIFEWWIVSQWFYEKLKDIGEPVIEWGNNYYWGRCCTGQAILLDSVISYIAEGMEILEGQSNEWKGV